MQVRAGEQQVLPVHDSGLGAPVVTSSKFGEVAVERGYPLGIVGDAPVGGDGRAVAALEVVAKRLRFREVVNGDGLASDAHVGDPVAKQGEHVVLVAPERRRLRSGRGRGAYGFIVASI